MSVAGRLQVPVRVISPSHVTNPSSGAAMPAVTEPKLIAGNANLPLAKSIAGGCRCTGG
jgi:hypothetical protein